MGLIYCEFVNAGGCERHFWLYGGGMLAMSQFYRCQEMAKITYTYSYDERKER
jgi:hypothetical protein